MPNQSLRILIVDDQHTQRLSIEKMLNQLGYYRIAPLVSLEEVILVTSHAIEPFDLLIISNALAVAVDIDLNAFCRGNPQVRHTLIYDVQTAQLWPMSPHDTSVVHVSLSRTLDTESIKRFMEVIDPPFASHRCSVSDHSRAKNIQ